MPKNIELGYLDEDFAQYLRIKASKFSMRATASGEAGDRLGVVANSTAKMAVQIVRSMVESDLLELRTKQNEQSSE
jgi:hypothetical protein